MDGIMIIKRSIDWYRPYYFVASGKQYKVNRIHFYEDGKIICSSESQWLENKNGCDITEINIPVDEIKVKRKEKFDGTVFAISKGVEKYGTEKIADLYIPASMLNIHFVEYKIMYGYQIRKISEGDNDIYIMQYVKSLDVKLNTIRSKYEEVYNKVSDTELYIGLIDNVLEQIDKLKHLAIEYKEEEERLHNLTIDDIEIENEDGKLVA